MTFKRIEQYLKKSCGLLTNRFIINGNIILENIKSQFNLNLKKNAG